MVPAELDLSTCPFMWPFCKQPLYAHAMPTMVNATVLNGMGLTGVPCWHPAGQLTAAAREAADQCAAASKRWCDSV